MLKFLYDLSGVIGREKRHSVCANVELLLPGVFYPCAFSIRHVADSLHMADPGRNLSTSLIGHFKH